MKESLRQCFEDEQLDEVARSTGFCKRKRTLTPRIFLEMLLCKDFDAGQQSLLDHCRELAIHQKISVTKQSLNERFNTQCVEFIQKLIAIQIGKGTGNPLNVLKDFSHVYIHDSTKFKLPGNMQDEYKGYGVKGMAAGASIQFCYDLRYCQFVDLKLTAATRNDSLEATNNKWITKGALVVRDLGYFSIEALEEITQKEAYYISKAMPRTHFYSGINGKKLDLKQMVRKMEESGMVTQSASLHMGKEKLPVRVIFQRVSDEVYEKRIREKQTKNKSRGWGMSDEYRIWAKINVFITNIPEEMTTDQRVLDIYKLRWQIELVFKTWKSHYNLHRTKEMKKTRIKIYLYSTLLLILVHWRVYRWLEDKVNKKNLTISLYKLSKYIMQKSDQFNQAVLRRKSDLDSFIRSFLDIPLNFIVKEVRQNKLCYSDIVLNKYG